MGYISMQPSIDKSSTSKDAKILQTGGACLFDVSKSRVRSQSVAFGYRYCIVF